ncbi:MAG: hypothetical protein AAFY48_03555 [Bacteroidota bacterium]
MLAAVLLLVLEPGLQLAGTQALGSQFLGSQTFTQSAGLQLAFVLTLENCSNGSGAVVETLEALVGAGVLLTATLVVAVLAWQEGVVAAVFLAWHWVTAQEGLAAVV